MGTPQLYRTPLGWTRKSQPVWSDISVWPPKCFSALTDNNPTDRLQHVQKLPRRVQRGTNSRLMPGSCCLYNVYIMCRSRWSLFKTFFSPPTNTYKQQRMYRLTVALVHTNTPFQLNLTLVLGYGRCSSKCYKRRFVSTFVSVILLHRAQLHSDNQLGLGGHVLEDVGLQSAQHVRPQQVMELLDLVLLGNVSELF